MTVIPSNLRQLAWVAVPLLLLGSAMQADGQEAPSSPPRRWSLILGREATAAACPDESELRQQVEARAGREVFVTEGTSRVLVRLSMRRGVHRAEITFFDGDVMVGERAVEDRDCGEVVESTAVLLTMLVAPLSTAELETVTEDPPGVVASDPMPPQSLEPSTLAGPPPIVDDQPITSPGASGGVSAPVSAPAERDAPEVRDPLHVAVTVGGGVIVGWVPDATMLLRAGIGIGQRAWSAHLEARGALDTMAAGTIEDTRVSALVSWAGGAAVGCGHIDVLALCGHVVLARSAGRGVRVDEPQADETWVMGVGASASLGWMPWTWLRLGVELELDVPLVVPEARIDGVSLWRATPVTGLGTLTAGLLLE